MERRAGVKFRERMTQWIAIILGILGIIAYAKTAIVGSVSYPLRIEMEIKQAQNDNAVIHPKVEQHEKRFAANEERIAKLEARMDSQYGAIMNAIDNLHKDIRNFHKGDLN